MSEEAAKHIGSGIAIMGLWIGIGLFFMNGDTVEINIKVDESTLKEVSTLSKAIDFLDEKTDWITLGAE